MIDLLLLVLGLALRALNLGMLVYCVMSFVMPQSEWFYKLSRLIEPVLTPVRKCLYKWIPSLRSLPVDLSPLAVWLLIDVAQWILNFLGARL